MGKTAVTRGAKPGHDGQSEGQPYRFFDEAVGTGIPFRPGSVGNVARTLYALLLLMFSFPSSDFGSKAVKLGP